MTGNSGETVAQIILSFYSSNHTLSVCRDIMVTTAQPDTMNTSQGLVFERNFLDWKLCRSSYLITLQNRRMKYGVKARER